MVDTRVWYGEASKRLLCFGKLESGRIKVTVVAIKEKQEVTTSNCIAQKMLAKPEIKKLLVNPAFVAYRISTTTDLIACPQIGQLLSSKDYERWDNLSCSTPHPTTVIWDLFPDERYHTFFWPLAATTFGGRGLSGIPVLSIL